jgi:hypothetical protein
MKSLDFKRLIYTRALDVTVRYGGDLYTSSAQSAAGDLWISRKQTQASPYFPYGHKCNYS